MENDLQLINSLRGVPLTCFVIMVLAGKPVSGSWLEAKTGYSRNTIVRAVRQLSGLKIIERNPRGWGWVVRYTPPIQHFLQAISGSINPQGEFISKEAASQQRELSRVKNEQILPVNPPVNNRNRVKIKRRKNNASLQESENRANNEQILQPAGSKRKSRVKIEHNKETENHEENQNRVKNEQIPTVTAPKRKKRVKIDQFPIENTMVEHEMRVKNDQNEMKRLAANSNNRAKIDHSLRESRKKSLSLKTDSIYLDSPDDLARPADRNDISDDFSKLNWSQLLAATDELFGESVIIPDHADPDIRTFLALVAEIWQSRHRINYPARIMYVNLRNIHQPARRFYKNPVAFLPDHFLAMIGLRGDASRYDIENPDPPRQQEVDRRNPQDEENTLSGEKDPDETLDGPEKDIVDISLLQAITPGSRWTAQTAWLETVKIFRDDLDIQIVKRYLDQITPAHFSAEKMKLTLAVPDLDTCLWIESRLGKTLWKKYRYVSGCEVNLEFIVKEPPTAGDGLLTG